MLLEVVGDLLPAALGVALSPIPVIAVTVVLGTPRARSTGSAFALGWVVGLTALTTLIALVTQSADSGDADPSRVVSGIKVALGVAFLAMAVKKWRGRPRSGVAVEQPKWMADIDSMGTGKALVLGLVLSSLNPKNLALTVAAATSIGEDGLTGGSAAVAVATFVVLGSLSVVGPTAFFLVAPRRASGPLGSLRDFMSANSTVILLVVLLLLGVKLLGDGLGGLG